MAYYYYYHQPNQSSPESPESMASELTPSMPSVLLLSSPQQQQTLPLLTPILPSVTSSVSVTSSSTNTGLSQQHQLPTPNTFIRHCEDMGLFHDLQNVVIMSPLSGSGETSAVSVTTTTSTVTTPTSIKQPITSNMFGLSSTAVLTTMMMANPFDETFKQAVLEKQKNDLNPTECIFNNHNNDDELNTPFIPTTCNTVNLSKNKNISNLIMTSSTDTMTTAIEAAPLTAIHEQQNIFIKTAADITSSNILMIMTEQQQQQQQQTTQSQHKIHHITEQQHIIPTITATTNIVGTTTMTCHDQTFYDNSNDENGDIVNIESEKTSIKEALKKNLLVKRLLQEQQKSSFVSERYNYGQLQNPNNDTNIISAYASEQSSKVCKSNDQEDSSQKMQPLKKKQKEELLARNRTAAKRCRMKRKERWELLSEENRKLKVENFRLRNAISKLITRGCNGLQHQLQHNNKND